MKPLLPGDGEGRLARLEARLGRCIRVRLVWWPDPRVRGRIRERGADLLVECNDVNPGFFWHGDVSAPSWTASKRGRKVSGAAGKPRRSIWRSRASSPAPGRRTAFSAVLLEAGDVHAELHDHT